MAWAKFTKVYNHDFRPAAAQCVEYRPSNEPQEVTRAVLEGAMKVGAAQEAQNPKKKSPSKEGDERA